MLYRLEKRRVKDSPTITNLQIGDRLVATQPTMLTPITIGDEVLVKSRGHYRGKTGTVVKVMAVMCDIRVKRNSLSDRTVIIRRAKHNLSIISRTAATERDPSQDTSSHVDLIQQDLDAATYYLTERFALLGFNTDSPDKLGSLLLARRDAYLRREKGE